MFFLSKEHTQTVRQKPPGVPPPSSSLVSTAEREWAAAAPLPSSGRSSGGGRDRTPPRTRPRHSEELVAASDVGLVPSLCHEARGFFPPRFATTALSLGVTLAQFFHFLVIFGDQDSNCSHCRERRAVGRVGAVTEASGRGDVRVTPVTSGPRVLPRSRACLLQEPSRACSRHFAHIRETSGPIALVSTGMAGLSGSLARSLLFQ